MMYLNSPQSIDPGTKNFFLSISGKVDLAAFSTMTGILSGYLVRMRFASADLFSIGCDSHAEIFDNLPNAGSEP
jgi:hypothetical protein